MSPNVFYAAVMMQKNQMFFGKGDFQKFLNVLKKKPLGEYKDIGRKLALVKQGFLYHANSQKGVNCETFDGIKQKEGAKKQKDVEINTNIKWSSGGLNELLQGLA